VINCPTPEKQHFSSKEAAEATAATRANTGGRLLFPYQCQCGAWHLSGRRSVAPISNPLLVERLSNLEDPEFDVLVSAELRGRATPEEAAALRTPELAYRWLKTLRRLSTSIQAQMAEKKGLQDAETNEWRAAMVRRLGYIQARSLEIKSITGMETEGTKEDLLRKRAANAAKRRLVALHLDEYKQLLAEELEERGLRLED
jgi:hypothetical protein